MTRNLFVDVSVFPSPIGPGQYELIARAAPHAESYPRYGVLVRIQRRSYIGYR